MLAGHGESMYIIRGSSQTSLQVLTIPTRTTRCPCVKIDLNRPCSFPFFLLSRAHASAFFNYFLSCLMLSPLFFLVTRGISVTFLSCTCITAKQHLDPHSRLRLDCMIVIYPQCIPYNTFDSFLLLKFELLVVLTECRDTRLQSVGYRFLFLTNSRYRDSSPQMGLSYRIFSQCTLQYNINEWD